MSQVLIWGKTREMVSGDLPAGLPTEEVQTLAALQASLDGRGAALVLADPACLEAEREALESWLGAGGKFQAVLVAVAEPRDSDDVLRRFPFVDDLLMRPVSPTRLRLRLERAFETVHNRRVIRQLENVIDRKGNELSELNKIGVALSAERDIDKLLELILKKSREVTGADAGSLYLVERGKDPEGTRDDRLRFKLAQNDSVVVSFEESTIPLDETSIAGYAALTGKVVPVADAYRLPSDSPYRISRSWDEKSGYRTMSILAVPMRDHENVVIGVVQLINKKRDPSMVLWPVGLVKESVIPFTSVDEELASSLASQAAVAFENTLLIQDIRRLFDSFVRASVTTIEKRDPTTSGHSERVAELTVGLAEKVDAATTSRFREIRLTRDQIQEIRYASLLHDFGKVGVKEKYLLKAGKLYGSHLELVEQRFEYIQRTEEVDYLKAKIRQIEAGAPREMLEEMDHAFQARREEIAQFLEMIREANNPSILEESVRATVIELEKRTYPDLAGNERPFLTPEEVEALSVTKGSLTPDEREEINKHVQNTYEFLKELPWTSEMRRVPEIAWKHHAKLDGSGYPRRNGGEGLEAVQLWTAPEIPIQTRMMTISDIYDALTAWDRPYKKSVPPERALDILKKEEAGRGKIDGDLLELFIEAHVWERTLRRG